MGGGRARSGMGQLPAAGGRGEAPSTATPIRRLRSPTDGAEIDDSHGYARALAFDKDSGASTI